MYEKVQGDLRIFISERLQPMNKESWIQVFKIGIGSAIAIFLAEWMGLTYATSAGIVTLLTIQNTRKDTFHLALKRILSFGVTMVIAALCLYLIPVHFVSFGVFMLLLVAISYFLDWNGAISVNAVIGTHIIFVEKALGWKLIWNEAIMVLIGIVIAIIFNWRVPSKENELQSDIAHIDGYMRDNLNDIAAHLSNHAKLNKDRKHLKSLLDHISKAIDKAYANKNNTLKSHSDYYINYLNLRKEQCEILLHVYYIASHHDFVVEEANVVAEVIHEAALHLPIRKEIIQVKYKIDKAAQRIIHGDMPENSHEFESKAVLYQLLYEMRELLWHQEMFVKDITEEQILAYWC